MDIGLFRHDYSGNAVEVEARPHVWNSRLLIEPCIRAPWGIYQYHYRPDTPDTPELDAPDNSLPTSLKRALFSAQLFPPAMALSKEMAFREIYRTYELPRYFELLERILVVNLERSPADYGSFLAKVIDEDGAGPDLWLGAYAWVVGYDAGQRKVVYLDEEHEVWLCDSKCLEVSPEMLHTLTGKFKSLRADSEKRLNPL